MDNGVFFIYFFDVYFSSNSWFAFRMECEYFVYFSLLESELHRDYKLFRSLYNIIYGIYWKQQQQQQKTDKTFCYKINACD